LKESCKEIFDEGVAHRVSGLFIQARNGLKCRPRHLHHLRVDRDGAIFSPNTWLCK